VDEDEQFNQAFGVDSGISVACRYAINGIKNNDAIYTDRFNNQGLNNFKLLSDNAVHFTDLSWRLFGRYIASNTNLSRVDLIECGITDEKMASLFYELTYSASLKHLDLSGNSFGIGGLRSMVPFLNDTNLSKLDFHRNNNFDSNCFELVVQTLHGRPSESRHFEGLFISSCNITNISVLDTYTIPHMRRLELKGNSIGREGCTILANMLQREDTSLIYLGLNRSSIDNEGAEILAAALKHNTKLQTLDLRENYIGKRGYRALLKSVVDLSSIENTYNSNHTLKDLKLHPSRQGVGNSTSQLVLSSCIMLRSINSALQLNNRHHSSHSAGRAKVIKYQLNSKLRRKYCDLQGIEYSASSIFADIEPTLLPRILALIGSSHEQSEFYTSLIHTAPDLLSCVDTSGMMKDEMAKNSLQMAELTRQLAALSAKNDQFSRRLSERESGDKSRQSTTEEDAAESVKKRKRSEDKEQ